MRWRKAIRCVTAKCGRMLSGTVIHSENLAFSFSSQFANVTYVPFVSYQLLILRKRRREAVNVLEEWARDYWFQAYLSITLVPPILQLHLNENFYNYFSEMKFMCLLQVVKFSILWGKLKITMNFLRRKCRNFISNTKYTHNYRCIL